MEQAPSTSERRDINVLAVEANLGECVASLKRLLHTTPIGWILVVWMASPSVPMTPLLIWVGFFGLEWAISLWRLYHFDIQSAGIQKAKQLLMQVAVFDGIAWGVMAVLTYPYSESLNSWMTAVLCGVIAVNSPAYITYTAAFRLMVGAVWVMAVPLAFANGAQITPSVQYVVGLSVFFVMVVLSTGEVGNKVTNGIRMRFEKDELAERLAQTLTQVEQLASSDALTGRANRRALDRVLDEYMAKASAHQFQFSILMLDVDWFKSINDIHGHAVGDEALRRFADRVNSHVRIGDLLARYGGEEFVLVMPHASHETALALAQRLRADVCSRPLLEDPAITVTVSIGVADCLAARTAAELLYQTDAALYEAKKRP